MIQVLTDKGNYEEADKYFAKAIKLDSSNATLMVHRGMHNNLIASYVLCMLYLNMTSSSIVFFPGLLQLQWKNDVEKALKLIEEAISLDAKCEFAYETLGTIEVQR